MLKSPIRKPAVGIDLGTTFSVIARLDDTGRPTTIVNAEGEHLTPSVVLIDGPDVIVGKEAVKALPLDAPRIAECAKRDMGQANFRKSLDGQFYPPEVLQACVLKKLVADARRLIGDFHHAVVTVPAYFDEVRRKATQDAGYLAGLEVLDIINEPTAAAVAYGFQHGMVTPQSAAGPQRVVVYDLGGGTFDVTVMEINGSIFTALATDGDVELGGREWDQRLVDFAAESFLKAHHDDPRTNPLSRARLFRECEAAKRTLSARSKATIVCDHQGRTAAVEITREAFEQLTQDLVDRTRFTTRQALKAADLDWPQIDRVLLVGGSSRMPMIRDMLTQLAGKPPDDSASADEAVAHGAALHAGMILARESGRPEAFRIANVNSHSLGIAATDRRTGRLRNAVIIPRNTPLPVTVERVFKTQFAGQPDIWAQIVEGESSSAENCTQIGQCIIGNLPRNLPAGSPVAVRFQYAANARLTVTVRIAGGAEQTHEIQRHQSLGREKLDAWRAWVLGS